MIEVETVALETHISESVQWNVDLEKLTNTNNNLGVLTINSPPVNIKIGSQGTSVKCMLAFQYSHHSPNNFTITFEEQLPTTVILLKFILDASFYRKNQLPNQPEKITTCSEYFELLAVTENKFFIPFSSGTSIRRMRNHTNNIDSNQVYRIVFILSTETREFSHKVNQQHTTHTNIQQTSDEAPDNSAAIAELVADFQNLYQTMDYADVTLRVGTTKIPAHRNILATRSKAFAAMLQDGADKIDIQDMSEDVLKELLRYFYTGKVKQLDLALDLVKIAKTSDITHLEDMCKKHLEKNMTVENCLEVLAVAYDFKMHDLKSFTVKFIVNEIDHVQKLDGWTKFINNYPELAVHLVAQFMNPGK